MSNPSHNISDATNDAVRLSGVTEHHIGRELQARRSAKGESPEQVAAALKIQASYIRAIDALDIEALPAIGYTLGYVRSYAQHVGLNGAQAVARYKSDSAVPDDLGRRALPHFVPKTKLRLPRGLVPALTILACAGAVTLWYSSSSPVQAAPEPLTEMLDEAAYAPAALPDDPTILTLKAVAPSWVQVTDATGRPVMSRIMVSDEVWSTQADNRYTLAARDGAAIELYQGQTRLGVFGEKGVAFGGIPLSPDALRPDREQSEMTPLVTEIGSED